MISSKRERFVDEYLQDRNATKAAIRAGYSPVSAPVTASRLMANTAIKHLVNQKQSAMAAKLEMDREQVLLNLIDACEEARAQKNPAGMIAACKEIAKLCGFYEPAELPPADPRKVEALQRRLRSMTDDQLREMLKNGK